MPDAAPSALASSLATRLLEHVARGEHAVGHRLTEQALAEAMGVSRQTINSIEVERYTPSLPLAIALARYFERMVEEVFHADWTGHDAG